MLGIACWRISVGEFLLLDAREFSADECSTQSTGVSWVADYFLDPGIQWLQFLLIPLSLINL